MMLGNNPTQMDSFNKQTSTSQGTLMANWFEQRVHRQTKGQGRAVTRTHLPKKHDELLQKDDLQLNRVEDDTKYRILGDTTQPIGRTQNYHYGKGFNKADTFAKVGKRQKMMQQKYLQQITAQLQQQQRKKIQQERKGQFETTNRTTFVQKSLDGNRIGRLVMRDQSGALVGLQNVDQQLRSTNGFRERGQIATDDDLKKLIDTDCGFEKSQPITFWKQKMQDGSYYMSKQGSQPFGKNNEFLKTFKHYKHYRD